MTYLPSFTGNWNLTWNAENRLVKAVSAYTKLEFTYDYKGRRIQKKVFERDDSSDLWSLTSDLRYVYNGWNLIATTKTTDSSQQSSFAKASEDRQHTVKTYTWGLDLSGDLQGAGGVGGLLSVTKHEAQSTTNAYYVSYDANGNVSEYIDNNGNMLAHYEYSPFGRLTVAEGSMAADFNHRFSTKYQNNETGLYYYGYRYYSAELGRWLSRDPLLGQLDILRNNFSFIGGRNLILSDLVTSKEIYLFVKNNVTNDFDLRGDFNWLGFVGCFAGLSQSELAALRGKISKEMLKHPKVSSRVSRKIKKAKAKYGKAWKKVRHRVIRKIRKKATRKVVKRMGRKKLLKVLATRLAGKALPVVGQISLAWDVCKATYCAARYW